MPYAWNGICYEDTASALEAFARSIPSADSAGINSFATQPFITAGGLITWQISNRPLTSADATVRTGTTQLLPCSTPYLDQFPLQSLLLPVAFMFAAFMGIRTGLRI